MHLVQMGLGLFRPARLPDQAARQLPRSTDNSLGGSFLHWCIAPLGRTEQDGLEPIFEMLAKNKMKAIVNRPFAMGALIQNGNAEKSVEMFRFINERFFGRYTKRHFIHPSSPRQHSGISALNCLIFVTRGACAADFPDYSG